MENKDNRVFNLSTHIVINSSEMSLGKFIGKIELDKDICKTLTLRPNATYIENMNICGLELIGTPEEIMHKVKLYFSQNLAKADLEDNRKYINEPTQEELIVRMKELQSI